MKLLLSAVTILSFVSVGLTAPTLSCESLTQTIPIENTEQLLGKWIYVGEAVNIGGIRMLTKKYVDSAFVNVTTSPGSNSLHFFQAQKSFGQCISFTTSSFVANNSLQATKPYKSIGVLLTTGCPDCVVVQSNFTLGSTYYQSLQLLSRRRVLSSAELAEFTTQAECLKLPVPVFFDPEKELCTEQQEQSTESKNITALLNSDLATQLLGMIDSAINSEGGLSGFFNSALDTMSAKQH